MRKLSCSILLVLILFISGCTNSDTLNSSSSDMPSNGVSQGASSPISSSSSDTSSNAEEDSAISKISDFDISKIQGKIKNLYYIDNNQVLIQADKLYLYDLFESKILSQVDKESFLEEEYHVIDDGIVAVGIVGSTGSGDSMSSGLSSLLCVVYDKELNKITEIGSDEFIDENEYIVSTQLVTMSKDGRKIAFATNGGLFLYDINDKTKITLVNLLDDDSEKRMGLALFEQIAFVNDDNMIAFKSQSFDVPAVNGKASFDTYGTINIVGTGLSVNRSTDYSVKQMIAYNSFLFLTEDFTVPSGELMVFDLSSDKSETLKTTTKKESGNVFGSEKGQYFATSIVNQDNVTVRIYDMKNGSLLMEESIVKESVYMEREPEIRIIDDMRTCIVLLGNRQTDISTQYLIFNF